MIRNYKKLIDTIHQDCSKTKIYIESILPIADTGEIIYCNPKFNELILMVNESLKQLPIEKQCVFINTHDEFVLDKQMNPMFTYDGVHLTQIPH